MHNTYNETVINNVTVNRVSYNGGAGGIAAAPTPQERMAAREQHVAPTPVQTRHVQRAAGNPALLARNNGGRPSIAATPRPSAFNAPGAVGAHGAAPPPPHAPAMAHANRPNGAPAVAHASRPSGAHAGHGYGKPPAARAKAAKPHPKTQPQKGKHAPETARR
ncbi:MAG: hypothetical protein ACRETP_14075 [Steroidobacteraceae bacterium]